jgi:leucyl/phenylalanyl-tRNA---protein transferase
MSDYEPPLTAEFILGAYANGYFPMAKTRDDPTLHWFYPTKRAIIPLAPFHLPRSLVKLMRKQPFDITFNTAFPQVIAGCAQRKETWINETIVTLYTELWRKGYGHSVECWKNGELVGGVYGLAIGKAFFAESMFSRTSGASKVALGSLMLHLQQSHFTLLDVQYINPHLEQFGVIEITRKEYLEKLKCAIYA